MALIPLILNEIFDDMRQPSGRLHQHCGMEMLRDNLLNPALIAPFHIGYYRPRSNEDALHSEVSNIQCDKDGLKVNLDVQQFKPEELTVKVVDNYVTVEGKHEERQDEHGFISRQFQRRYKLPENADPAQVISQLSSHGILTISVPTKALPEQSNERVIPITKTQTPAINLSTL